MNKRPKSREETPKEGSDSARRYRTATICDRAAQNARGFDVFAVQNTQGWAALWKAAPSRFSKLFQELPCLIAHRERPAAGLRRCLSIS
jgi:hypothetical protein